ncbi:hypothetical protein FOZ61_009702 [Perkinsus olseni]|uniref:Uncharacterized protein n=1 Tax=Perkinsus olseni TaxID=32597 RepID=A0A7J6L164_PEROL|nr:hypothetical protein FOZ61_009702 [Perkinsus olseni]
MATGDHRLLLLLEVSPWRLSSPLATPEQIEEELQASLMRFLPGKNVPDNPVGMRMAVREAASSILYGTNDEAEAFNNTLKEKFLESGVNSYQVRMARYSSFLSALVQAVRELTPVAKAADQVEVGFFHDVTCEETLCSISSQWWRGVTSPFIFGKGQYDPERAKDYIIGTGREIPPPPPAPLWCQVEASAASRVLIITIGGDSANSQLAHPPVSRARRHLGEDLPHISVLHLGPDPSTEHLAEVEDLCAATGGFLLTCESIHSVASTISSLTQAFLARTEGLSRLLQQRRENHARLDKLRGCHAELLPNGTASAACPRGALLPSARMLEGLRDVTQSIPWLWGRAIREWRAWAFGVRDVAFSEPGPLGLDVAAPPPSWRVAATHPPASVLALPPQTPITAIGSMAITRSTSRRTFSRALAMRPVGLTLGDPYIRDLPTTLVGHLACLVVAEVMAARVIEPYKHNPPPVPLKDQSTGLSVDGDVAGLPTRVLVLVVEYACDLLLVGRLGLSCKAMHQAILVDSRTDRKSPGSKMIRYCLRNGALSGRAFRAAFLAWCHADIASKDTDRQTFLAEVWLGFSPTDALAQVATEDLRGSTAAVPSDWLCLHRRRCLRRLSLLVDLAMPAYFGALDGRLAGRLRAEGVSVELAVANLAITTGLGGAGVLSDVAAWESIFWSESEPLCELLFPLRLVIAAILVHKQWVLENTAENVMRKLMDVQTFQDAIVISEAIRIKLNRKWLSEWKSVQGLDPSSAA